MALAFVVGDVFTSGSGAGLALTAPSVNYGIFALFAFPSNTNSVTGISNSRGVGADTWQLVRRRQGAASVTGAELWRCRDTVGGALTITPTFTNAATAQIEVGQFSGFDLGILFDQQNDNAVASMSTPFVFSYNNITPVVTESVALAGCRVGNTFVVDAFGDSMLNIQGANRSMFRYRLFASSGTTIDADIDFSTTEEVAGVIVNAYNGAGTVWKPRPSVIQQAVNRSNHF